MAKKKTPQTAALLERTIKLSKIQSLEKNPEVNGKPHNLRLATPPKARVRAVFILRDAFRRS